MSTETAFGMMTFVLLLIVGAVAALLRSIDLMDHRLLQIIALLKMSIGEDE